MEHQYSTRTPRNLLVQPRYAAGLRNQNLQHNPSASRSAYSYQAGYAPVPTSYRNSVYPSQQPIIVHVIHPMQPRHSIPLSSYGYLNQQYLHQHDMPSVPSSPSYEHRFENLRQYQNSSPMGATYQHRTRFFRYMSFSEFRNNRIDMSLRFHVEDDVMVLHVFPPPSLDDIMRATQDLRISRSPARDEISDSTVDANLNIKIYSSSANRSGEESSSDHDMCVVCQAEYENNEKIGALRCGHQYHVECIKKWLRKKNLCPICKAEALLL